MKNKYAVCFRTSEHSMAIWVVEEAEDSHDAAETVKREFTVHEIIGVYKEQPEWKWR